MVEEQTLEGLEVGCTMRESRRCHRDTVDPLLWVGVYSVRVIITNTRVVDDPTFLSPRPSMPERCSPPRSSMPNACFLHQGHRSHTFTTKVASSSSFWQPRSPALSRMTSVCFSSPRSSALSRMTRAFFKPRQGPARRSHCRVRIHKVLHH
jgi:hypothetical protein